MPEFFKNPQAFEPTDTVRYTFENLPGQPWLSVRTTGRSNRGYLNALLKKNRQGARAANRAPSVAMLDKNRDEDRELFPKHVVTGWGMGEGPMLDVGGAVVEFTQANLGDFFRQIPEFMFDDLRIFCADDMNFIAEQKEDVEETAGN